MTRNPVAAFGATVVCDDGSAWTLDMDGEEARWREIAPIPGTFREWQKSTVGPCFCSMKHDGACPSAEIA